jgi:hypothetical protein
MPVRDKCQKYQNHIILFVRKIKKNVPKTILCKCRIKLEKDALRAVLITAETIA